MSSRRRRSYRSTVGAWMSVGLIVAISACLVLVGAVSASTRANLVTAKRVGMSTIVTTPDAKKPSGCSSITVSLLYVGSGSFSAGNTSDLVLGSTVADNISARSGNDCLVGGAGNDDLDGGLGTDVCIGGLGTDTFKNCEINIQ